VLAAARRTWGFFPLALLCAYVGYDGSLPNHHSRVFDEHAVCRQAAGIPLGLRSLAYNHHSTRQHPALLAMCYISVLLMMRVPCLIG
jgi:hypothetical protein